ncbi:hypothetical protein ECZC06_55030 [Escherichia coli]|nr:hypothetical protein ECZC06_55030 [Escherichia coli]
MAGLITELISLFELQDRQVNLFIRRYESEHGSYEVPLPQGHHEHHCDYLDRIT